MAPSGFRVGSEVVQKAGNGTSEQGSAQAASKGELRRARKAARAAGEALAGPLALQQDRERGAHEWTETARGYRARERWARRYDSLNGAPESDYDR